MGAFAAPAFAGTEIGFTFGGDSAHEQFARAMSSAGDVDDDGFEDIAIAAPFENCFGAGRGSVRIISGRTQEPIATLRGDAAGDQYGTAVAGGGDVNNDGYDDVLIGACGDDDNGTDSGSVFVVSGEWITKSSSAVPDTPRNLLHLTGGAAGDNLGTSVAFLGDVNSDGVDDLIAGAPGADVVNPVLLPDGGLASIYSGSDGSILHTFPAAFPHESFGWAVARAGDVDDDGETDVIIGGPFGLDFPGVAEVFSASGRLLHEFVGHHDHAELGFSVAGVGDVNGDGNDDVLVGSPGWSDGPGFCIGQAEVFSGKDGSVLHVLRGRAADDNFGWAVAGVGDLDKDNVNDFLVGAPCAFKTPRSTSPEGSIYIVSGASGDGLALCWGEAEGDHFGASVGGVGDLTGNGIPDLLAGAPRGTVDGSVDAGRGYVLAQCSRKGQPRSPAGPDWTEYRLSLSQSSPNPFRHGTTIRYEVPRETHVRLRVYDVRGRLVRTLVDRVVPAAPGRSPWDGRDDRGRALPAGIYVYRLELGETTASRKAIILR